MDEKVIKDERRQILEQNIDKYLDEKGINDFSITNISFQRRNKGYNAFVGDYGILFKFDKNNNIFYTDAIIHEGKVYNKKSFYNTFILPIVNEAKDNILELLKNKFNNLNIKDISIEDFEINMKDKEDNIVLKIKPKNEYFGVCTKIIPIDKTRNKDFDIDDLNFALRNIDIEGLDHTANRILEDLALQFEIDFIDNVIKTESDFVKELFLYNNIDVDKLASKDFIDTVKAIDSVKKYKLEIEDFNIKTEEINIILIKNLSYNDYHSEAFVKKTLKSPLNKKEIEEEIEKLLAEEQEKLIEEYNNRINKAQNIYNSDYFKDKKLLCYCVLKFLITNEYLSRTALIAFLNGRKMNSFYKKTVGYGAFKGSKDEDVYNILDELEEYNIVYASVKDNYGNRIVSYHPDKHIKPYLNQILDIKVDDKEDPLYYLLNKSTFDDIEDIQRITENKTILIVLADYLKSQFDSFDETIKLYITTMADIETDKVKKKKLEYIVGK